MDGLYLFLGISHIQTEMNHNKKLSKTGLYSIYASAVASDIFATGYSSVKSASHTNIGKFIGGTFRYFGMV